MLLWTLVAWGGRLTLLAVGGDWWDWVRIGGSFLIGVITGIMLLVSSLRTWAVPATYVFSAWTTVIWIRSMIANWTVSGALGLKLVHTALAIGFGLLVWWALAFARSDLVSGPDQANREQQGQGESGPVTES